MKKIWTSFGLHAFLLVCFVSLNVLNALSQTLYLPSGLYGIGTSGTSNAGIGTSNPLSKLSVGADGLTNSGGYFYNAITTDAHCYGLVSQSAPNSDRSAGFAGVTTINTSTNYAYGIMGQSYGSTPLSNGRTYGVMGAAGNATSGWNYGVYGWLNGPNNGAAVFGTVLATAGGDEDTQGQYAGYFKGNVYMSTQLSIGYKTASYTLDVNGYIRGYNLTPSDERLKENIKDVKGALSSLTNLHGVTYNLKQDGITKLSKSVKASSVATPDTGKTPVVKLPVMDSELYNRSHIGFLAQEVQKVFPELVYTDKEGVLSVDYVSLIPVLVESIKELDVKTTDLQATKDKLNELENRINQCCGASDLKASKVTDNVSGISGNAVLYQNAPNPFNQNTTIAYYLPETVKKATLNIYNMEGKPIKVISISGMGNNSVVLSGSDLSAGMYIYTLIADGKEIDTKRMILTN
jgi:hypothetical protein